MLPWVSTHPYDAEIDAMLSDINIKSYLTILDCSFVLGRDFLSDRSLPRG